LAERRFVEERLADFLPERLADFLTERLRLGVADLAERLVERLVERLADFLRVVFDGFPKRKSRSDEEVFDTDFLNFVDVLGIFI